VSEWNPASNQTEEEQPFHPRGQQDAPILRRHGKQYIPDQELHPVITSKPIQDNIPCSLSMEKLPCFFHFWGVILLFPSSMSCRQLKG